MIRSCFHAVSFGRRAGLCILALVAIGWGAAIAAIASEGAAVGATEKVRSITHYGVTWTFDREYPVGRFVNGDWWVVGPVKVVLVSPASGPAAEGTAGGAEVKSIYGAAAMTDDARMRHGSMVSPAWGPNQGYDSRLKNYRPELSAVFPLSLKSGDALVSTISNETLPVRVMHHRLMWTSEQQAALALRSAAVLTVLARPAAADAFRPAYTAGSDGKIFTLGQLRWDRLPALPTPAGARPEWAEFERYLERPWLNHIGTWFFQHTGPSENQVNYGREFSRITSIASLMLMLDAPREKKERLMIGLVQLGIDLRGLAQAGANWTADGGHWNGRKWPVLFAGLVLGDDSFATQAGRTIFSEDQQMYYGDGWQGANALYQIVLHTGPKQPHEEKAPADWDAADKRAEGYRIVVSGGLPGTALAAQLMGAKALWNHDAFFDYYDRWMATDDAYAARRGGVPRPKQEGRSLDHFVDAMWAAYRSRVPVQSGGGAPRKWVWIDGRRGEFVANERPAAAR